MLIHLLFIIFYVSLGSVLSPEYLTVILILQCIVAGISSGIKNKNFINPYNINLVAIILASMGNLSLLSRIDNGTNYMYYYASVKDLPLATTIWCVGNSLFLIGYLAFEKFSFPSVSLNINKKHIDKVFYVMLFLILFSDTIMTVLPSLGTIAKALRLVGVVGIMFFARLWAAENTKKYRNYALILYALQTYMALTRSYLRAEIILPTVILFIGFFTGKRSIKYLFSYRIIPLIAIVVIFVNMFSSLGKSRSNFGNAFVQEYFSDDASQEEIEDVYNGELERGGFIDRSATLAQTSAAVGLVNKNDFYDGAVSAPLVIALVPRVLWPDKPSIVIGQWFAIEIGAAYVADGKANNSINITIPGQLYMDFGWLGVIVGCFLFGAFVVCLWNTADFAGSDYNLLGGIFGGYILFMNFTGITVDLQILITYISIYIVFLIAKKISCAYFV